MLNRIYKLISGGLLLVIVGLGIVSAKNLIEINKPKLKESYDLEIDYQKPVDKDFQDDEQDRIVFSFEDEAHDVIRVKYDRKLENGRVTNSGDHLQGNINFSDENIFTVQKNNNKIDVRILDASGYLISSKSVSFPDNMHIDAYFISEVENESYLYVVANHQNNVSRSYKIKNPLYENKSRENPDGTASNPWGEFSDVMVPEFITKSENELINIDYNLEGIFRINLNNDKDRKRVFRLETSQSIINSVIAETKDYWIIAHDVSNIINNERHISENAIIHVIVKREGFDESHELKKDNNKDIHSLNVKQNISGDIYISGNFADGIYTYNNNDKKLTFEPVATENKDGLYPVSYDAGFDLECKSNSETVEKLSIGDICNSISFYVKNDLRCSIENKEISIEYSHKNYEYNVSDISYYLDDSADDGIYIHAILWQPEERSKVSHDDPYFLTEIFFRINSDCSIEEELYLSSDTPLEDGSHEGFLNGYIAGPLFDGSYREIYDGRMFWFDSFKAALTNIAGSQ